MAGFLFDDSLSSDREPRSIGLFASHAKAALACVRAQVPIILKRDKRQRTAAKFCTWTKTTTLRRALSAD
ncbi:hypothetical protein RLO149_c011460 [Roseobacter litoralis Och 149]|uniref:Uncharacterized protein n=1 Tax=Roseobacter litoralis (strain ATCC 49566 / DSM 6996 / JCM 21268 / NBRC 15278 / OCh 149) TaxID=391595 RepID=F7ZBV8_ROSLO|nr:hypothetical protein RLO149_c011460 [Roseobacter litoralis Och 149]